MFSRLLCCNFFHYYSCDIFLIKAVTLCDSSSVHTQTSLPSRKDLLISTKWNVSPWKITVHLTVYFLGGDLTLFSLYSGYTNILVYTEVLTLKIEMPFFFNWKNWSFIINLSFANWSEIIIKQTSHFENLKWKNKSLIALEKVMLIDC